VNVKSTPTCGSSTPLVLSSSLMSRRRDGARTYVDISLAEGNDINAYPGGACGEVVVRKGKYGQKLFNPLGH
jgi:hypothetical protein